MHELSEQVRELSKVKQELHDQVEHWKFRAQEALEHKALDVMTADQNQVTSATEDILLDIKKLQQVCRSAFDPLARGPHRLSLLCVCGAERGVLEAAGQDSGSRLRGGRRGHP